MEFIRGAYSSCKLTMTKLCQGSAVGTLVSPSFLLLAMMRVLVCAKLDMKRRSPQQDVAENAGTPAGGKAGTTKRQERRRPCFESGMS